MRISINAVGRIRHNLALQHLIGAARQARHAQEVVNKHIGREHGPHTSELNGYAAAAVLLAVASCEANLSERIFEQDDPNSIRNRVKKRPLEKKYQILLCSNFDSALKMNTSVSGELEALRKLRNALVHFYPEWHDEEGNHSELERYLDGKFELSPFVPDQTPFFPLRCLSHGCAHWAVKTTLAYMNEFYRLAGLENPFANFLARHEQGTYR